MNAARAIGNRGDRKDIPLLIKTFGESPYETVRGMCAWSLARLGGSRAKEALESRRVGSDGLVRQEIDLALEQV
jgi:epoxyqueuosine reductase